MEINLDIKVSGTGSRFSIGSIVCFYPAPEPNSISASRRGLAAIVQRVNFGQFRHTYDIAFRIHDDYFQIVRDVPDNFLSSYQELRNVATASSQGITITRQLVEDALNHQIECAAKIATNKRAWETPIRIDACINLLSAMLKSIDGEHTDLRMYLN